MAATDHLNNQQFFHGSDKRIRGNVGDKTRPDVPNTSFFTNDPEHASDFGRYVYQVEPTGPYEEDSYEGAHPEGKTFKTKAELRIRGRG